jgi:ferrochelatase
MESDQSDKITILPMFPQFSYATTGSIARWFAKHLSSILEKMHWVKSYPVDPSYIRCMEEQIRDFLEREALKEEETILLFSPHGLPQDFILRGDPYKQECESSYLALAERFPKALCKVGYQSKFGKGEWLRPATEELCREVLNWSGDYQNVLFIPLSFTSDHIETLFEVEYQYMPLIRERKLQAYRLPALGRHTDWIASLAKIIQETTPSKNSQLYRKPWESFFKRQSVVSNRSFP